MANHNAALFGTLVLAAVGISFGSLAQEQPGAGTPVRAAHDSVLEGVFQHEVLYLALEELGYETQPMASLDVTSMHVAVGTGNVDFTAVHWDPLQTVMFEQGGGGDQMERVGVLSDGAVQGYLIDKATAEEYGITNIAQLRDPELAALFDHDGDGVADLTGCNPGWGCERVIEHHLDAYELRDTVEHNQGSYLLLIANTIARYEAGEPIFYYTWTPQWVGGVLVAGEDVVWLEVPFTSLPSERTEVDTTSPEGINTGFGVNQIRVVANTQFLEDNPAARRLFEVAAIPLNDISAQNLKVRDGEDNPADIRRHAEEWVEANRSEFDSWLEEARTAAAAEL